MLQADLLRDPALSLALTDKARAAVEHTSLNHALGFRAGLLFFWWVPMVLHFRIRESFWGVVLVLIGPGYMFFFSCVSRISDKIITHRYTRVCVGL